MNDDLKVNFDKLEKVGDVLITLSKDIRSREAELTNAVNQQLIDWEGDASNAFRVAFAKWVSDMDVTVAEVEALGNIFKAIRNRYYSIELDVEDNWRHA